MLRAVAHLIYDFLAPEQPEDCHAASLALLERTLAVTGPVILEGQIVSADESGITFDLSRAIDEYATEDHDGKTFVNKYKIPADNDLSAAWKLPAASTLPIPVLPPEPEKE